ncbi:MAG: response regulator, partial [Candidatus Deferrimicrobium sp.]
MATAAQQVLIAAPSDLARGSLERILGGSGLEVIAVSDGGKALSETMVRKPDVLVLDLSLSLMSTSRLVKILRTNPNTKTIPILFLGEPGQEVPEEEEGVAEVLRRPFLDEDVLARVRGMVARGRRPGTGGIAVQDEGRRKERVMTKR